MSDTRPPPPRLGPGVLVVARCRGCRVVSAECRHAQAAISQFGVSRRAALCLANGDTGRKTAGAGRACAGRLGQARRTLLETGSLSRVFAQPGVPRPAGPSRAGGSPAADGVLKLVVKVELNHAMVCLTDQQFTLDVYQINEPPINNATALSQS